MSRKDISMLIGRVFLEKCAANLLYSALDRPDFFWDAPDALQVGSAPEKGLTGGGSKPRRSAPETSCIRIRIFTWKDIVRFRRFNRRRSLPYDMTHDALNTVRHFEPRPCQSTTSHLCIALNTVCHLVNPPPHILHCLVVWFTGRRSEREYAHYTSCALWYGNLRLSLETLTLTPSPSTLNPQP
jgi:hypothetical protein